MRETVSPLVDPVPVLDSVPVVDSVKDVRVVVQGQQCYVV
jgi:hypothetical protein